MENILNLDKLPNDVLLYLASFLYIEDIICLSMTCKYLRNILPLRLIRGPSIDEYGPDTWDSWQPSIYFDAPTLTSYILTAAISMTWKDHGWGVQKGKVWIQLMRPRLNNHRLKLVYEDKDIFGDVPHKEKKVIKILSRKDPIISLAQPGDHFRFMKNVGGGCWRWLMIKDLRLVTVADQTSIAIDF